MLVHTLRLRLSLVSHCRPRQTVSVAGQEDGFFRAMHFSAKRGISIACRLSHCPMLTNGDIIFEEFQPM